MYFMIGQQIYSNRSGWIWYVIFGTWCQSYEIQTAFKRSASHGQINQLHQQRLRLKIKAL